MSSRPAHPPPYFRMPLLPRASVARGRSRKAPQKDMQFGQGPATQVERDAGPGTRLRRGERAPRTVTWRAVALALVLLPVQSWWVVQIEVISANSWPSMLSLPLHTLFLLLLLVAANYPLRRRAPRWALAQGELLVIYTMLAIGGAIAGYGGLQSAVGWIIAPVARATAENRWEVMFGQHLPPWLIMTDKEAVQSLLEGQTKLLAAEHLRAWAMPALTWGAFFLAFFASMLSLNTLLRRRWIEEERLSFPLVQVPLAVTGSAGPLFRSRLFWLAFGLAFAVGLLNGLHVFWPALPLLQLDPSPINESLRRQWSTLGFSGGVLWPPLAWAIGVGFLMPVEIAFSYWFFYLFMKAQQVLTAVWGWDVSPEAPFPYSQSAGALVTLAVFSVWSARKHLWRAVRAALHPEADADDAGEPMRYRRALLLLALSLGFMAIFLWRAGAPAWLVPVYFGLFLSGTLAISRLRAELGAPANELHHVSPHHILTQLVTPAAFPLRALTVLTVFAWTSRSFGLDPTPYQIEGFKMAERTRLRVASLPGIMVLAAVVGLIAGFAAILAPLYRLGADSSKLQYDMWAATAAFSQLQGWATAVPRAVGYHGLAMGGSVLFTAGLFAMRSRFLWWPFHPVGYVMAPMWFTHHLWLSILLAWVIKVSLLRYGGRRSYDAALPFFYGLILGDCVIGGIWALLAPLLHTQTFSVWI